MAELIDNAARSRFEMAVGHAVAVVNYARPRGNTIELTHTEVPETLAGQGVGSRLAKAVLDRVRANGLRVVPSCPFIAAYIERNPEYRDLVL